MLKAFRNFFFPLVIIGIIIFIAFKNYLPGTWLLGWDNLVPELNFKLNIARSVSAVWQEYQGVGLLGGMAHAADLPRQLVLWGFATFLPASLLRYLWAFLMLMAGPLGVYFLVSKVLLGKKYELLNSVAGFVSAVFYIFNLATIQTFFTPFETFICFYGFFPWLLFAAAKYLTDGKKSSLLIFAIISFLAAPAFYVQTLFVVYIIFLFILALEAVIRKKGSGIARSFKLALVTLFINAFWLFPATYFAFTNAGVTQTSHINSIATPETQIMNKAKSGFADVATLKGYWFDYYDWDTSGNYNLLYQDWISYQQNSMVGKISLALFVVSVIGLILVFFKSKKTFGVSFILLLGISFFMLSGGSLSFLPYFSEAFRNVFTKWSTAMSLILAVGLGFFVYTLSSVIKNNLKYIPAFIFSGVIIWGSVYSCLPILKGKLIADSMKVNLPSYYQDTINYFKTIDPTTRIAAFPLTDFWGWQFNDWGYRGSGFIWYGIQQPILSRTFDVWSLLNEEFYNDANYALSWGTVEDFERILAKYQVKYLIFDDSIFLPGNPNSTDVLKKEKEFIKSSGLVSEEKTFGKITIYKINIPDISGFVSTPHIDYSNQIYQATSSANLSIKETFSSDQGYKEAKNCNLDGKGSVSRLRQNNGNYYLAENDGVSCDYFYYPDLDYSKAYEMRIVGKNISGRSLRFYLYNVIGEKVYMDELLPSGDFDKTYLILPTGTAKDIGGYTLNVETRSFGIIRSENLITAIEFHELPVEKTEPTSVLNNLQILDVKKYWTWGYGVVTSGSGLVELGQGYEEGWIAFPIVNSQISINNFYFNYQALKHVKVNSWANGWIVPSTINNQQSTIFIVFWPQALEWGGMIAGGITFLILVFKKKNTP